jgi:hypothetical protein
MAQMDANCDLNGVSGSAAALVLASLQSPQGPNGNQDDDIVSICSRSSIATKTPLKLTGRVRASRQDAHAGFAASEISEVECARALEEIEFKRAASAPTVDDGGSEGRSPQSLRLLRSGTFSKTFLARDTFSQSASLFHL